MKTLVSDRASVLDRAAEAVCALLKAKPDAAVTMAAGRTMLPLWERLGELVCRGELSFSEVRFFQTAEFLNAPEEKTFRHMTEEKLLAVTDLKPEHCFWLSEENLKDCDEEVFVMGGAAIYEALLPFTKRLYITRVYRDYDADVYFPTIDMSEFTLVKFGEPMYDEESGLDYAYEEYDRKLMR